MKKKYTSSIKTWGKHIEVSAEVTQAPELLLQVNDPFYQKRVRSLLEAGYEKGERSFFYQGKNKVITQKLIYVTI